MVNTSFLAVIVVVGLGTYLMRAVPIVWHGSIPVPPVVERLLKHVLAAVLTALVVPAALYLKTDGVYDLAPERTIAALAALLVALKWRSVVATLAVGMGVLWIAQAII